MSLLLLSALVLGALAPGAMSASAAADFVFGSDFVLEGGPVRGPVALANCIRPPPVANATGAGTGVGELQTNQNLLNTIPDPNYAAAAMPADTGDWIDLRGGAIYTPPGSQGKCFNRSFLFEPPMCAPSAENNYCFEYIPLFGFTWRVVHVQIDNICILYTCRARGRRCPPRARAPHHPPFRRRRFVVGSGICVGSYPEAGAITAEDSIPPPGSLGVTLSNQCGESTFGPTGNATSSLMATIADPDGNKYALQLMLCPFNASQAGEWQAYLESAELPPGWTHEMVTLTQYAYRRQLLHHACVPGGFFSQGASAGERAPRALPRSLTAPPSAPRPPLLPRAQSRSTTWATSTTCTSTRRRSQSRS
jgi:hypothetical protein